MCLLIWNRKTYVCYMRRWSAPYHVEEFLRIILREYAEQYYQDYSVHDCVVTVSSLLCNELQKPDL